MTTKLRTSAAVFAAAVAAPVLMLSVGTPSAGAEDESCSFELSAPHTTTLPGGASVVTATVRAKKCTGLAQATDSYVCVTTPGGAQECTRSPAWSTAQVYVSAGGSGTYTAKGKGCWGIFERSGCVDLGSVSATL